jgi:ArsR family transcriptional regulator
MYYQVFTEHANFLKAMSHPKRLEILHLLRNKELSVSEIQDMLDLPQANLSQHLMVLRDADILSSRRNSKQIFYKLAHKNFIKASDLIRKVLIEKHKDDDNADEFAQKMTDLVPLTSDPVCGMRVSPHTASYARKYNSKDYYFCASGCLEKFKNKPDKYVNHG